MEGLEIEWTENTFGYLSIPTFLIGIILFSFPEIVYKIYQEMKHRMMKPNYEFEDVPKKEIPVTLEKILKIIGMIMITMGVVCFWFSKEFYRFLF